MNARNEIENKFYVHINLPNKICNLTSDGQYRKIRKTICPHCSSDKNPDILINNLTYVTTLSWCML